MPSTSTSHKSLLSQPVSKPAPTVSALSAVFTAAPLLTSATDQPEKQTESGQSAHAWQYRSMGMKNVVDFEKMYQFMSNLVLKKHTQPLTAMGKYSLVFVNDYFYCFCCKLYYFIAH